MPLLAPPSVPRYGVWEYTGLTYNISGLTNPQDQVTVTATFNCASCTPNAVTNQNWPGFYDLTFGGTTGNFRVRYVPQEIGTYSYSIAITGPNGTNSPVTGTFSSVASTNKGFIRKQAGNASRLVTETSGTATSPDVPQMFEPIGVNQTATGNPVGSGTLSTTYTEVGHSSSNAQTDSTFAASGMTLIRMSLGNSSPQPVSSVSTSGNIYSAAQSLDADTAFGDAKSAGLHIWTTFFVSGVPYPNMETDSGGSPSAAEETAVENAIRYDMARYGAYTDIWELANESSVSDAWITKLAAYIHAQDPYSRLVTNSNANTNDIADGLDLKSVHVTIQSYDAYTAMTNFGASFTNPVVWGEIYANAGASSNMNWDLYSPAIARMETWSGMTTGLGAIFWMDSAQQGYPSGTASNFYLGPEERNYFRPLQNIAQSLDPAGTVSNPAGGVYALGSTHTFFVYFNGNRVAGGGTANFGTLKTTSVTVNIPLTGNGSWIEPSSGRLISTQTISSTGSQTLAVPSPGYYEDIAFVLYGSGWGASGACAPLPCPFAGVTLPGGLTRPPVAMPRVSRGLPAYSTGSPAGTPANAVSSDYSAVWGGSTAGTVALDISSVTASGVSRIYFADFDDVGSETPSYDHALEGLPSSAQSNIGTYTWNINTAAGGSLPGSGWQNRINQYSNTYNARTFSIKNGGDNWLQLAVTAGDGSPSTVADIKVDIHDGSNSSDDMWLLLGDQLVQDGLRHQLISGSANLSDLITTSKPSYTPLMIDAGIGGMTSTIAARNINRFLGLHFGKFVSLQFGADDAIAGTSAATYYANLAYMIQAILVAGKIPVVSTPDWSGLTTPTCPSPGCNSILSGYDTQVLNLYAAYPQVVAGPDLWGKGCATCSNPIALSDGIHPSSAGYATMRTLYSQALLTNVYSFGTAAQIWPQLAGDPERDSHTIASVTPNVLTPMYWRHFFAPEIVSPQAEPIINNNLIYLGTEYGNLYALTLSGSTSWTFSTAGPIEHTAAATSSAVYVADMTGALYALNPTTGAQLWKRQLTTRLGCNTAVLMDDNVAPSHVLVGCRDGNLYAVDPNPTGTGAIQWTYSAGAPLLSSPASHGGLIFVVSNDLYLHAVNVSSGTLAWKSAKLGGIGMTAYYPAVVPEPGTTTYRVVVRTWPVTSYNITGEPLYPNDFTAATQSALLSTIQANPSNYRPDFIVFANDGTNTQRPLGLQCLDCQTMHSPSFPGCLDANGYLVVTSRGAPNSGKDSGWAEYNIATGQYVAFLQNTASPSDGYGNRDENLTATCTANGVAGTHAMEGNANFTGFFTFNPVAWTNLTVGSLNIQGVGIGTEGNGSNPTAIAAGVAVHNALGVLTVRHTQ